ncbi:hypothetical protein ACFOQM_10755 [Paenibacillus sp. GCM10012307]|uniref:Antitoxin VbhA domain-containing protein n=1 Tax=Paenibacillus roseus TaxID=2798579 RepID=A0A934MQX0_9BACL|nr:hypothetical protein [Paenibacillus roseus]MBJ6361764.1 hypothetical protein [Paenibacillus roseus]
MFGNMDRSLQEAKASLEIEGMKMPVGSENLIKMKLNGDISQKEFIKRAAEMARSTLVVNR